MKITLDTDKIKLPQLPKVSLKDYSDREVFFICVLTVLFGYITSDYLDSKKYSVMSSRIDRVEVSLDKVINQMNEDTISNDVNQPDHIYNLPKAKYTSLTHVRNRISLNQTEFDCFSRNIYWEAMHEPLVGQIAIGQVTHNRLMSGKWGNTYCSVVFSPKQFSWTNFHNIKNARPKNEKQWNRAQHSARLFLNGTRVNNLDSSQYYYAQYIKRPKWSKGMQKDDHIGKHIFYTSLD